MPCAKTMATVQFNHVVEERETVPNVIPLDSNGTMSRAATMTLTRTSLGTSPQVVAANGARIVVAVLEGGGSNYNHVDLIGNHWVNDAEIPGNGVDDDENGFVDDYDGWNATNNSDNISAEATARPCPA